MLKKTKLYTFISWLIGEYRLAQARKIDASKFRYFGNNVTVSPHVRINRPDRVILKEGVNVQSGALVNSLGGLYVGRYSGIGYNCVIFTAEHRYRGANAIPFDNHVYLKPVIIRDFVWIGANVKIMPGVEIGEGAILGMGAVVTKDVKPHSIVVGNPANIVGYRSSEEFEELKKNDKASLHVLRNCSKETIFPMHRRKFKKELEELGLLDNVQ